MTMDKSIHLTLSFDCQMSTNIH